MSPYSRLMIKPHIIYAMVFKHAIGETLQGLHNNYIPNEIHRIFGIKNILQCHLKHGIETWLVWYWLYILIELDYMS